MSASDRVGLGVGIDETEGEERRVSQLQDSEVIMVALLVIAQCEGWVIWWNARQWRSATLARGLTVGGAQGLIAGSALCGLFWLALR
jgi:hypothetical protein